jgi:hypothetical protein
MVVAFSHGWSAMAWLFRMEISSFLTEETSMPRLKPKASVVLTLLLTLAAATSLAQPRLSRNPDDARLVTSDIPAFWRVFDKASLQNAAELFENEYIDPGSAGLHDFVNLRIGNASALAATVAGHPRYYAAIRESTLAIDRHQQAKQSIRASFVRLKELYPDAVFPDVYFVIGRMNSAGTTSSNGLLIGVEMNARSDKTPVEELSPWERAVIGQITSLPYIVAHELIHYQQPRPQEKPSLLDQALMEGSADFVGEMISGGIINRVQRTYGDAHQQALWEEFRKEMSGYDLSNWMYNGDKSKDRPADLGYYIGYKICESFNRHATDHHEALRHILNITDAAEFLKESGYSGTDKN